MTEVAGKPKCSSTDLKQPAPYAVWQDEDLLSTKVQKKCHGVWTTQGQPAHCHGPIRHPPLSLLSTWNLLVTLLLLKPSVPTSKYTLPQANAILCSYSCLLHIPRVPVRANKRIQPKLTKEAFQIAPTSENIKNIKGSNLCSQCSKVNEELNQNQLEVAPEIMETPAIPAGEMCSQWLENIARELRIIPGSQCWKVANSTIIESSTNSID